MALHAIRKQHFALTILTALAIGVGMPPAALGIGIGLGAATTVDIDNTPPDATVAVPPDLAVTFDDSGSMALYYMGDTAPFNGNWDINALGGQNGPFGPWICAGVIDDSGSSGSLSSHAMNGVYYNPAILYLPPVNADGSSFPAADATLAAVQDDGVTANRPLNPQAGTNTNFTGTGSQRWTCFYEASQKPHPLNSPIPGGGPYYYRYTGPALTTLPNGNPDGLSITRLYNTINWTAVPVLNTTVMINGQSVNQWQNWANWWAYYRTRNLMTRTSLSRVFGSMGATTSDGVGYGSPLRAAWQNLYDGSNSSGVGGGGGGGGGLLDQFILQANTLISALIDTDPAACRANEPALGSQSLVSGTVKTPPSCYRSEFFNWIFQVPALNDTPTRGATIRAGEFFKRGNGNTAVTGDLHDPYWQPGTGGASDAELYCRKNFHLMVTDGFWNGDAALPTVASLVQPNGGTTLPDGTVFPDPAGSPTVTAIYQAQHDQQSGAPSLSDIGFNYWASDLRPDLYDPAHGKFVPPYLPDGTTGVTPTGAISASSPHAANVNEEVYFNPQNDPANWPHMAEYMVGLGVSGVLNYSQDTDCTGGAGDAADACNLRKGLTNSTGAIGWPAPSNQGLVANIDDTWHTALAGRGQFFSAGNPQNLVDELSAALAGIITASTTATAGSLNSGILTTNSISYSTGYDTDDWSGQVIARQLDPNTGAPTRVLWDAGCLLTGGLCAATGTNVGAPRSPGSRVILTNDGSKGVAFEWGGPGGISTAEQAALNTNPATGQPDGLGQDRLNWLRGDRTKEGVPPDNFRQRKSVLGAVINSQSTFVAYPDSGYNDDFPAGSPEATAAAQPLPAQCSDANSLGNGFPAVCDGYSYEAFVYNHRNRPGTIYVGANDGMMHAFDASATGGQERWAYVPYTVFNTLNTLTNSNFKYIPTVDSTPLERDVFFSDNKWHTELIGTLRLGGRGVYALDITNANASEGAPTAKVLWEFNNTSPGANAKNPAAADNPANLGYTFGQANVGRLNSGKWVVLVPGGYFPDCTKVGAPTPPCGVAQPAAASNKFSSLFVLDAQTGQLIKELRTSSNPESPSIVSSGLARPVLGNYGDDELDDVAFAGDLQGNLWRFDLSDSKPANWTVDLAYKPPAGVTQAITSMPRLFPDPITQKFIVVFGTGKYLGASDTTVSAGGLQAIYGIREAGAGNASGYYPAQITDLVQQDYASAGGTLVELTDNPVPAMDVNGRTIKGWYFNLDITVGERVVVTPAALFNTNRAIFVTLIPGEDPCNPVRTGTLLVIDATTGGPGGGLDSLGGSPGQGYGIAGSSVSNVPASGELPVSSRMGGAELVIPGLILPDTFSPFTLGDSLWRRRSWRVLDDN